MDDENKTRAELISELSKIRRRVVALEGEETEREQAQAVVRQYDRELTLLNQSGQVINSTLDLDQTLNIVMEAVRQLLGANICSLWLVDSETEGLVCRHASHELVLGWRLAPNQGIAGWVASRGQGLIVPDTRTDERHFKDIDQQIGLELRSILSVPLQVKQQVIGIIQVMDTNVGHFNPTDLRMLQSLAAMVAIAIENLRLYEQAQEEISKRLTLEEMWRRYEFIVNTSKDFMTLISQDHIYEQVNDSYSKAYSKTREEVIGRKVADVWGEARYLDHIKPSLDQCFAGNEVHHQEWFEFAVLGRRYFDVMYYPYYNAAGKVTHVVVVSRDLTAAKHLEEQLRQAQKMEAIGTLAGGIAHDFNNLLTAIMGYAGLALESVATNHPAQGDLQGIQKTAERAANLTYHLLAFARKQLISPQILNLNTLILDLDKMLRRLIREDIELVVLLGSEPGLVKVDPNQFEQVLVNLVVNARNAMPNGGKLTLEIVNQRLDQDYARLHTEVTPGEYVMLAVKDTGIGITEEVKAHLFEPFFTTRDVGEGTGLGLAICFGIVKQSGGHIDVDSKPGQGTTFKIYLPRVKQANSPSVRSDSSIERLQGTETVLLVEDEPAVRALAVRVLRQHGYTVLEAANGDEALQVAQPEIEIDLLLTDIVMPQMGGKILADQLRVSRHEIKVLFISGYTGTAAVDLEVLEPGVALLPKPFTPEVLAGKVREVLDQKI